MDEDSQELLRQAFLDYKNGKIEKHKYDNILADLKGLQSEEGQEKDLSDNFTEYINRDALVDTLGNNAIVAYIGKAFEDQGKKVVSRGEVVKMMSGQLPENGLPNTLMNKGNKILNYSKYAGEAFMGASAVIGIVDDVYNHDKTSGEAVAHSAASIGVGIVGDAAGYGFAYGGTLFLGASNPVGWATIGGIAVGSFVTWGFGELYDRNFMGMQDTLDNWGEKIDEVTDSISDFKNDVVEGASNMMDNAGDALKSGLNFINPFS